MKQSAIIKISFLFPIISFLIIAGFTACNEENFADREYYKNIVYLLSKESYNVYTDVFSLNDGQEVTGYFSVGCGGSKANQEEIVVELEADTVLLNKYNRSNFDIDVSKYAQLLSKDRYTIETNSVVFPAGNKEQYVKVAVTINPDGLSPDSTYFIPIAIKSVSRYEINPEKSNLLFRIVLENYYATQLTATYYQMKGNILNAAGDPTGAISSTKLARPISKNAVRLYAGNESPQTANSSVADIEKSSILLTVDDNKHVNITPYGSIEVEQIEAADWNTYEEIRKNAVDESVDKYFNLLYRYRTVKTPAVGSTPAVYNNWIIVQERLKRLE
jgi:hypothetical protein